MSEKSIHKKLVDKWFDDDKSQQRAREERFFEKDTENVPKARPKSKASGTPRADHKHDYKPVVIWKFSTVYCETRGSVGARCTVCGKKDNRFRLSQLFDEKPHEYCGDLEHFREEDEVELTPVDKTAYRKTIFLGGSKTVNELSGEVRDKLVDFMNLGYKFVVGDCTGADRLMQNFLAGNNYKNVVVYCSGTRARVNVGSWEEKYCNVDARDKNYDFYKRKDEIMSHDADEGFMILNGATRGTMANVERLVSQNKKCYVAIFERYGNFSRFCVRRIETLSDFDWLKTVLQN